MSYTQGPAAVMPEKQQRADPVFPQADMAVDRAAGGTAKGFLPLNVEQSSGAMGVFLKYSETRGKIDAHRPATVRVRSQWLKWATCTFWWL